MLKSLYLNELEAYINRLHNFVEWPPIAVVHHHVACTHADHKRLHRQLHRFITLTQDTDLFLGIICILCTDTQVIKGKRVNEVDLYSTFTVVGLHTQGAQGPDLQNIIRQSYDKVMTMTEVMTNHTTDAIYKKSYDKVMINL